MTGLSIRSATPADADGVAPLLESVGFPVAPGVLARRMTEQLGGHRLALVAIHGAGVVGVVTAGLFHVLHREAPVGRITLLAVASDAQGQGIGRALVDAAEDELARRGVSQVEVISNHRYAAAHGFYEHLGYEQTSLKYRKLLGT